MKYELYKYIEKTDKCIFGKGIGGLRLVGIQPFPMNHDGRYAGYLSWSRK